MYPSGQRDRDSRGDYRSRSPYARRSDDHHSHHRDGDYRRSRKGKVTTPAIKRPAVDGTMDLVDILFEILGLCLAYIVVYVHFRLLMLLPQVRRMATAMALMSLTLRLMRTVAMHITDWTEAPLPQAMRVILLFGTLAEIGAPALVTGGLAIIMIDTISLAGV
ncbi:14d8a021-c345-4bf7-8425-24c646decd53 [Thermothielavioides terrestris]|uniref:14d8a021-c345-4bf7-8425-24c646decd53 n=1 Tax=Thermothielavioides terrestris TaxID=2587410 RepID=A0A446BAH4_9PEZI|nr:14d8a021-c345-4bf7-8425-24c646decd53 [Thermothielavioides terrestris]